MLAAQKLTVRRGRHIVLRDVSVEVRPGVLTAVVGPNGAGKSTLLGALTGVLPTERGEITLGKQPTGGIARRAFARQVSVLQQRFHSAFAFKAFEIVAMGRSPFEGQETGAIAARLIGEAVAATEVGHLVDRPCNHLSGGELQRVFLARALAQLMPLPAEPPRHLLLDEPTASLDLRHQAGTLALARAVSRQGVGVLAVLHDLNLAAMFADQILVLQQGRVAALGMPADVLTTEVLAPVYGAPLSVFPDPATGRPVVLPAFPAGLLGAGFGNIQSQIETAEKVRQ